MTYAAEVLADSPLVYWKLDETTGATAADSSGNSKTGSYVGSPSLGSAGLITVGTSVVLASGKYVTLASESSLTTTQWTDRVWIKTTQTAAAFVTLRFGGATNTRFAIRINDSGHVGKIAVQNYATGAVAYSTTTVNDGVRHMVELKQNATTLWVTIDGADEGTTASTAASSSGAESVWVGSDNNGLTGFVGTVDEYAHFGTALSSTRSSVSYTAGITAPPTPPQVVTPNYVRVEVAFTTSPDDPAPAWRDLTSRLDIAAGVGITRGRQDEYGAVQPGRCNVVLDNTDGELTAGRAASSFYPNVKPSRRMRVTYRFPDPGNLLTANQASVETSVADWTTTSAFGFIGGSTGAQSSTRAVDGTKSLLVTWPTTGAGNTAIYYTPVSCVIGRTYTYSVSVWVPTGSTSVKADVLLTNASTATALRDQWVRLSVTFTAVNSTHQVGVSVVNSTAGNTVYVDAVMVDEGSTLNAFTTTAPAIEYRYDGYVEEWPTEWPGGNKYTQARLTAVDVLARLGTKRKLKSVIAETVLVANPVAYYQLGEPEGSTMAGDVAGRGGLPLSVVQIGSGGGALTFGAGTGPGTDSQPAPMFAPTSTTNGYRLGAQPFMIGGDEPANAVGWIYDVGLRACALTSTAVVQTIAQLLDPLGYYIDLRYDATGHLVASYYDPWAAAFMFTITSANVFSDGLTHNPGVTMTQSGGTVTATLWDGSTSLGTATFSAPVLPKFTQLFVGGGRQNNAFTGTLSHVAVFNTVTSAQLGDMATAAGTGFAGERSDQRIARIASWAGFPTARQILDVGMSTSIAHVDPTGKKPLDAMQQIADTEGGVLFADRQGNLVFYSRARAYTAQPVIATVDAHDVSGDVSPRMSKQELVNYMTGKRTDGGPTIVYEDTVSQTEHGVYEDSVDLAVTSDNEVLSALQWRVNAHSQPTERVPDVDIDAMTNAAIQAQVRAVDVWSRFQIMSTPTQSHASMWDLLAQGYSESISLSGWRVVVNATNASTIQGWRVDDATFSQVDAGYQFVY